MNLEEYSKERLWAIIVEAVHASVMYPSHKAYVRDTVLRQKPEVTPLELTSRFNMPLGEALVILEELKAESRSET
jgi:hypothetical protein